MTETGHGAHGDRFQAYTDEEARRQAAIRGLEVKPLYHEVRHTAGIL